MDLGLRRARRAAVALVFLATLVLAAGCAVNPVTGKRELSLVSADQELQIGKEGYAATLA